jgi:hypothetical protein
MNPKENKKMDLVVNGEVLPSPAKITSAFHARNGTETVILASRGN